MTEVKRTGAQHLVQALRTHGVRRIFCVPGESYLSVLDALVDARRDIDLFTCRHEGAAAHMAEATGKLTGEPGVCFVTRGPGATHASIGVHTAFQDSSPLVLFIGQIARGWRHREAFQEIDYESMFGRIAKWVARVDDPARLPEYVSRAFHTAVNGRPGPVVLELPEDVLCETVTASEAPRFQRVETTPVPEAMSELRDRLSGALRPMVILGGGGWTGRACADLCSFSERNRLPVATSWRRRHLFDNRHPNFAGEVGLGINPKLAERVRASDLILAVGARLGENPSSGYTLFDIPVPAQTLIHVHPGAEELGRVYAAQMMINATMPAFARALGGIQVDGATWADWTKAANAEYGAFTTPIPVTGKVNLSQVFATVGDLLPDDAVVTNGAGNYAAWLHRFHRYRRFATQAAPISGAMGYGVPAAIAAKTAFPDRAVVCVAGDGCFMMSATELATACQYDLAILFLVINNGSLGTIRMHQERNYPDRVSGTDLTNPDFVAFARSFGCESVRVTRTEDFADAFIRMRDTGGPALIELVTSAEDIAPGKSLSSLKNPQATRSPS